MDKLLLASLIPFLLWIFQKIRKTTSSKATYIRRRIFAWSLLVVFPIDLAGIGYLLGQAADANKYNVIGRLLIRSAIIWIIILVYGFRSGKGEKETRGYWFSIWEAYKPEYMEGVSSKTNYVTIDDSDLLSNRTKPKDLRTRD